MVASRILVSAQALDTVNEPESEPELDNLIICKTTLHDKSHINFVFCGRLLPNVIYHLFCILSSINTYLFVKEKWLVQYNKPYDEVLGAAQLIKRVKACKSKSL